MQALVALDSPRRFEQEGGGPIFDIRLRWLRASADLRPPAETRSVLNYHQKRGSGSRKEDTSGFFVNYRLPRDWLSLFPASLFAACRNRGDFPQQHRRKGYFSIAAQEVSRQPSPTSQHRRTTVGPAYLFGRRQAWDTARKRQSEACRLCTVGEASQIVGRGVHRCATA